MKLSKFKSFVFGLAFLGSMGFGGIKSQAQESVDPGEGAPPLGWQQMTCPATGGTYEVCWYFGDGNSCSTWGDKTRNC